CGRRIAIAVDVLSEQLNLGVPLLCQPCGFRDHAFARAATLRPASEGHDAIGARFVTALDDGDVRAMRIVASRQRSIECLVGIQAQTGDAAVTGFELNQHLPESRIARRTRYKAHVRRAVENFFAFLLRHASQYAEYFALARFAFEILQPA